MNHFILVFVPIALIEVGYMQLLLMLFPAVLLAFGLGEKYDEKPVLQGYVSKSSSSRDLDSLNAVTDQIFDYSPGLFCRSDVQNFLRAKSKKLRKSLLQDLYRHSCIDWKFLGKLVRVAKSTGYI